MTVNSKHHFLSEISGSKYYDKFVKVPDLLDSFGELLNKHDISIGIAQNFDLKYNDGNVICRIEQDGHNVKISSNLNGASKSINKKEYYLAVRRKYQLVKSKTHVNTSDDVNELIEIIEKFLKENKHIAGEVND